MSPVIFWVFVAIMLFFGGMVVLSRSPVASALSLVVSLLALAGLFVSLNAFFIGVIEILVYAGAVMVLFLFIIMLLDLKAEQRRNINVVTLCGSLIVLVLFLIVISRVSYGFGNGHAQFPALVADPHNDAWHIGMTLFTQYNLPLQVVGVLILVASIGVVILSKRELK
jgi:NADH-quinone oxidoreductase subunit J